MVRNSFAHLAGRIASLLAGLVAIPLVTITSGTEALGLVGAYAALQAMLGLFDLGLPVAVNRHLALLIGRNASSADQARLIRSLEVLFWLMTALFAIAGFLLKEPLANSWFNVRDLPRDVLDMSLTLIIAAIAVRFPVAYYCNVLFAFDRHIFPNAVLTASAILRTMFAVVALTKFDVGIIGFFVIQLIANIAEVILLAAGVWLKNQSRLVTPNFSTIRDIAGTAGILTAISLTAVVLSQIDKIILSKILTLGDFGIYSAAYALASGLLALSYPVGNAVFPQLNQSLDRAEVNTATGLLRISSELTIFLVVPLGAAMAAQAPAALDILFLVRPAPADLAAILPLMMLGGIAQGFVTMPHLYQVAAGRASIVLWINLLFLGPYAALVFFAAVHWGLWGAALSFAIFNIARLLTHWFAAAASGQVVRPWRSIAIQSTVTSIFGLAVAWWLASLAETRSSAIILFAATVAGLSLIIAVAFPGLRMRCKTGLQKLFVSST